MSNRSNSSSLKMYALRLLSRHPLTAMELKKRLLKRKTDEGDINEVVTYCLDKGYIDEKAIAEDIVRRGKEYKLNGRFKIRHDLRKKGIPIELVQESLDKIYPAEDEYTIAMKFAQKRFETTKKVENNKRYNRIGSALNRKGFASHVLSDTMRKLDFGNIEEDSD